MAHSLVVRRLLLGLLVATTLLLAACGGSETSTQGPSEQAETRTIKHLAGTTEVPVAPQRIVTLQDQNALLPLLELGVRPVASAGRTDDDGSQSFRRTQGYDTSGIEFVGEYGEPNLEAIAAQRPDLIISDEFGAEGVYDKLSQIAPTVFVQVFERPLSEALMDFAAVVGAEERAEELRADYDRRIKEFRAALGDDLDDTTVSLLAAGDPGTFYQADAGGQALFTVMNDLEVPRPAAQGDNSDVTRPQFSLEQLSEHDADAVIVVSFGDGGADELISSKLWDNLAATRAGQSSVIDGTTTVGSAWGKMDVFLDELERILLADDFNHDVVQEKP